MKILGGVVLGLIGLPAAVTAQPQSIDQSRYFATPEIERAEFAQRLEDAAAFPAVAPADPLALGESRR
jgi:hypothetical protein